MRMLYPDLSLVIFVTKSPQFLRILLQENHLLFVGVAKGPASRDSLMQFLVSSKSLGEGPVSSRNLIQGPTFNERLSQSLGEGNPSREALLKVLLSIKDW